MHIESKQIEAYIERQARKFMKDFDNASLGERYAHQYGVAVVMLWDVIMDLEPDIKAKKIKQIKAGA